MLEREIMKLTILDDKNKRNILRIEYLFLSKKDTQRHATTRALLSYLLVMACKKYPNNALLCKALDRLYGAQVSVTNLESDNHLGLSFYMDFINPNSLNDNKYTFKDCVDIFKEIVYNPLIIDNHFDELIFNQQQDELYDNILSDLEDKGFQSYINARALLYKHMGGYIDSDGALEDVKKITNADLVKEYRHMIECDDLIIRVYGNLSDNDRALIDSYNDKICLNPRWEYKLPANIIEKTDDYKGYESYLRMAYYTGVFEIDKLESLALSMLSRMLAGDATSLFFNEIREKRGLCYNIKCQYNSQTSFVTVACEHKKENTKEIMELVDSIINDIKNNNFSDELMESARALSINRMLKRYDSFTNNVIHKSKKLTYGIDYTIDDIISLYKKIKREDIVKAAKSLAPVLRYCFRGILE